MLAAIENGLSQIDAGAGRFCRSPYEIFFDKTKLRQPGGFKPRSRRDDLAARSEKAPRRCLATTICGSAMATVFANNGKKAMISALKSMWLIISASWRAISLLDGWTQVERQADHPAEAVQLTES